MIIYDCEIVRAIHQGNETVYPDIEYCDGWHDFDHMGISCICTYDTEQRAGAVFLEDNLNDFHALAGRSIMVGYNSERFDKPLLNANCVYLPKSYDLLAEILRFKGLDPGQTPAQRDRISLNALVRANFPHPPQKTMPGHMAPVLWQRGKYGTVINYCMNDVMMLAALMDRLNQNGFLMCPKTDDRLRIRKPTEVFPCD